MAYGARFDPEKTQITPFERGRRLTEGVVPAIGQGARNIGSGIKSFGENVLGVPTAQEMEQAAGFFGGIKSGITGQLPASTPTVQPTAVGMRQPEMAPAHTVGAGMRPLESNLPPVVRQPEMAPAATGGFTGVHAARDETGYVVPSTFKTAEEAKGFRQFREELTRSDRPSVAKILQRDPVTGEYWTQEFMQGTDLSPQYADLAKTQKDFAQARLFGAQAEAQPTETASAAGLRGAQAQEAQARAKAIQENKNLLKFTTEVPDATGLGVMKQERFYDPAKNQVLDPMGGTAPPSRATAAAAYSALDAKKKSVVDKYFFDKYPDSEPPPDEFMSYIASLK